MTSRLPRPDCDSPILGPHSARPLKLGLNLVPPGSSGGQKPSLIRKSSVVPLRHLESRADALGPFPVEWWEKCKGRSRCFVENGRPVQG